MPGECIALGEGVYKRMGNVVVLEDSSFCFSKGMSIVWAPNGSGKTTLVKLLTGILSPDKGRVALETNSLGVLLEDQALPKSLRVYDLVEFACHARRVDCRLEEVERLSGDIGLPQGILGKRLGELSMGTLRKALILQALVGGPETLILDDPFSSLDPSSRIRLSLLLNRLRDEGTTIIVTTHVMSLLEPDSVFTIAGQKVVGPFPGATRGLVRVIDPENREIKEVGHEEALRLYEKGHIIIDA
ncbi:MAG: ATP-binding cassette domain-containing protein [Desulfurococcales archaeon]|nr:ATP-binding cassette domain-containing protein [Desulfurococcales archaeon]